MKKRPYRAEQVQDIDVEAIARAVDGQRVVVGVDIAKSKMRAVLMSETRETLGTVRWEHPKGTRELIDMLLRLQDARVEVVMDSL